MPTFTYWVQLADFGTYAPSEATLEEARSAFVGHDWERRWEEARALAAAGRPVCPPGIGFVEKGERPGEDRRLLHVRPVRWDAADVTYVHPSTRKRLFGLLPDLAVQDETSRDGFAIERVTALIELFFESRHAELVARIESEPGPAGDPVS